MKIGTILFIPVSLIFAILCLLHKIAQQTILSKCQTITSLNFPLHLTSYLYIQDLIFIHSASSKRVPFTCLSLILPTYTMVLVFLCHKSAPSLLYQTSQLLPLHRFLPMVTQACSQLF